MRINQPLINAIKAKFPDGGLSWEERQENSRREQQAIARFLKKRTDLRRRLKGAIDAIRAAEQVLKEVREKFGFSGLRMEDITLYDLAKFQEHAGKIDLIERKNTWRNVVDEITALPPAQAIAKLLEYGIDWREK